MAEGSDSSTEKWVHHPLGLSLDDFRDMPLEVEETVSTSSGARAVVFGGLARWARHKEMLPERPEGTPLLIPRTALEKVVAIREAGGKVREPFHGLGPRSAPLLRAILEHSIPSPESSNAKNPGPETEPE